MCLCHSVCSDRPYSADEDEERQLKRKNAEIKKLEEAAKKLKEGEPDCGIHLQLQ